MVILHKLILNNRYLRYTPFWWWWRLISHEGFRFDDYHVWGEFWHSINSGYLDTNYKWEFENFWGKGSYPPEKITLSSEDYDALVQKLNEPPQYNENLAKLLNRKAPWEQ